MDRREACRSRRNDASGMKSLIKFSAPGLQGLGCEVQRKRLEAFWDLELGYHNISMSEIKQMNSS